MDQNATHTKQGPSDAADRIRHALDKLAALQGQVIDLQEFLTDALIEQLIHSSQCARQKMDGRMIVHALGDGFVRGAICPPRCTRSESSSETDAHRVNTCVAV
jgi:hypothetical protein